MLTLQQLIAAERAFSSVYRITITAVLLYRLLRTKPAARRDIR